jgi:hypothetical protein
MPFHHGYGSFPYGGYMMGGYGMMSGYGGYGGGYGGYGGGYGGGGYGGGGGGGAPASPTVVLVTTPAPQGQEPINYFDALGLPNRDGHLDWPLGLRVLPPGPQTREIRQHIEELLQQGAQGNAQAAEETGKALGKLRQYLAAAADNGKLAPNTIDEARQFLGRLDDVVKRGQ